MREIKFRAKIKNPHVDKWVYGYLVSEVYINEKNNLGYTPVRKETIGQYTGLKDKNGKEIYEGDIVKSILILRDGTAFKTNIDVVEWNEIDCSFMLGKGLRHFNEHLILEVTGNIYDNPKMLEEEIC